MQCFGWTGTYARKTTDALCSKNNDWSLLVLPIGWVLCKRQERLKGTMWDAQITTSAIGLSDGHHGLSHVSAWELEFFNPSLSP
tara:strand:+ start:10933 stop:11184 length:252 start_codon:yes stop_codon:yes gene_type:complete